MCDECGAICLGSSDECFRCFSPKSTGARPVSRQVTAVEDAGPRPCLDGYANEAIHGATATAALNVESTPPAAYYARAAPKRPESFRVAALLRAEQPRSNRRPQSASRKPSGSHETRVAPRNQADDDHKDAIAQLKAEQQARREAAEAQRLAERQERQARRDAQNAARLVTIHAEEEDSAVRSSA